MIHKNFKDSKEYKNTAHHRKLAFEKCRFRTNITTYAQPRLIQALMLCENFLDVNLILDGLTTQNTIVSERHVYKIQR